MNNARRKAIQSLIDQLADLFNTAETLCGEEQEYYDNMPESLQGGEKGEAASAAADALSEAVVSITQAVDQLEEAMGS